MEPITKSKKVVSDEIKFNRFYSKEILSFLEKFEKQRRIVLLISFLTAIPFVLIICCMIFFNENDSVSDSKFKASLVPVLFAIYMFIIGIQINKYKKNVKNIILPKILNFTGLVDEGSNFDPRTYVSELKLFDYYNRYSNDDILGLKYNEIHIDIAEIHLQKETGSGKHRRVECIFKGILIRVPSFKKFTSRTVIKNRQLINNSVGKEVQLEDPEFMKNYYTSSTNQIESRYLITPAFMQRMIKLNNKKLFLSFEKNYINIAISSYKDWFDVSILKSALKRETYKEIVNDFKMIISIIDSLKLEQNIGM